MSCFKKHGYKMLISTATGLGVFMENTHDFQCEHVTYLIRISLCRLRLPNTHQGVCPNCYRSVFKMEALIAVPKQNCEVVAFVFCI